MRFSAIFLFLIASSVLKSQQGLQAYGNAMLGIERESRLEVLVYDTLKVTKRYSDQSEATNTTIEELFTSLISADTEEWYLSNELNPDPESDGKDESYYDYVRSMDTTENYLELIHGISFDVGGVPTAIVKFRLYQSDQEGSVSGAYVMQQQDERWYNTSTTYTSYLAILVMRLRTDVLLGLFTGNTEDEALLAVRSRVINGSGSMDMRLLEEEFLSWYEEGNEDLVSQFTDPASW